MTELELYKKMYATVCGAMSDSMDLLAEGRTLEAQYKQQKALERAEEMYCSWEGAKAHAKEAGN